MRMLPVQRVSRFQRERPEIWTLSKPMKLKFIIVILLLLSVMAMYFFLPDPNRLAIENLKDVVAYIQPEAYYVTDKVFDLRDSDAGQGTVALPKKFDIGQYKREPKFVRQEGYVGPESCKEGHAKYYEGFVQTAHYQTSALASAASIRGVFDEEESNMQTKVDGFRYKMTSEDDAFFQKILLDRNGETYEHKRRFDIVTGSGKIGQTYLYWEENSLYQLPVSWLAKSGWINSPNFRDGFADFARPIKEDCMTCHSTRVEYAHMQVNVADRQNIIFGVTCERCHGPAESHVNFHRENPDSKDAKFIVHPGDLPRERMNDICSQCHSGQSKNIQSQFNFRPGDSIHDFKLFPPKEIDSGGSVHTANQHPRLLKSKCYMGSDTMNCATCHNPHQQEHGKLELFSERCIKCHEPKDCGQFAEQGEKIASNCIDCHMPVKKDKGLKIETTATDLFPEVRDHFIRVDEEATQRVLDDWIQQER